MEFNAVTYGASVTYMLVRGKGETPAGRAGWSRLTYDAFAAGEFDFTIIANLRRGEGWKTELEGMDGEDGMQSCQ